MSRKSMSYVIEYRTLIPQTRDKARKNGRGVYGRQKTNTVEEARRIHERGKKRREREESKKKWLKDLLYVPRRRDSRSIYVHPHILHCMLILPYTARLGSCEAPGLNRRER